MIIPTKLANHNFKKNLYKLKHKKTKQKNDF